MPQDLFLYIFLGDKNGSLSLTEIVIRNKFSVLEIVGIWTHPGREKEEDRGIIPIARRNVLKNI